MLGYMIGICYVHVGPTYTYRQHRQQSDGKATLGYMMRAPSDSPKGGGNGWKLIDENKTVKKLDKLRVVHKGRSFCLTMKNLLHS